MSVVNIYRKAKGFTWQINFAATTSDNFGGFTVDVYGGTFENIVTSNVTSYTIKKNGSVVTIPFAVSKGDSVTVESVVKTVSGSTASIKLTSYNYNQKDTAINSASLRDATRKHLFIVNVPGQTVTVIDTSTDTIDSVLTLPTDFTGAPTTGPAGVNSGTNWRWQSIIYRPTDDYMYVFGYNKVCKINANPLSPNFKQIVSLNGTVNQSSSLSWGAGYSYSHAVYDFVQDKCWLINNTYASAAPWDFSYINTGTGQKVITQSTVVQGYPSTGLAFAYPNKLVFPGQAITLIYANETRSTWDIQSGNELWCNACYVQKYNRLYAGGGSVVNLNPDTGIRNNLYISSGGSSVYYQTFSPITYGPDYDLIFAPYRGRTSTSDTGVTNNVYIIDCVTNASLGAFSRLTNRETNDIYTRSVVYSNYSKKFYLLPNSTTASLAITALHKYNPQTWINNGKTNLADMIDGFITINNSQSNYPAADGNNGLFSESAMAMNHLIPM
jgi:hypothetical protein